MEGHLITREDLRDFTESMRYYERLAGAELPDCYRPASFVTIRNNAHVSWHGFS